MSYIWSAAEARAWRLSWDGGLDELLAHSHARPETTGTAEEDDTPAEHILSGHTLYNVGEVDSIFPFTGAGFHQKVSAARANQQGMQLSDECRLGCQ